MSHSLFVHLDRCIACRACEVACEREHQGQSNVFVTRAEGHGAAPRSCRQCLGSPCAAVCPTGALAALPDGSTRFERARCTGCTLCAFACPFGVLSVNARSIARCDLCRGRQEAGSGPACVLTCPTGAIVYGDYHSFTQQSRRRAAHRLLCASRKAES